MVEQHESDQEVSSLQNLSMPKDDSKLTTSEILRRQGSEFEPPKEDIAEKQQYAGHSAGQTTVSSFTDPAGQANDQEDQQKKDAELTQKIEQLKQEDETLKNQKLPELREQLQQIQQNKEHEAQQSNSETDLNEDYYQGVGQ